MRRRWRRYVLIMEVPDHITASGALAAGFGRNGNLDFWIGGEGGLPKPAHIAVLADDRATVDVFHAAAIAAGGRDNGAYVLDPDGHNIEAIRHKAR